MIDYHICSTKKNIFYVNFINYFLSLNEFNDYYQNICLNFDSFLNKKFFYFKNNDKQIDLITNLEVKKINLDIQRTNYKRILNIYQNSHINFSENLNFYMFIMDIILPTYTLLENYNSYFINNSVLLD